MNKLNGKIALITGAGSGIGRETALLFSKEGASIIVADINGLEGEVTVEIIKKNGGDAIYTNVNVSDETACKEAFEMSENHFGRLDIVFNNAGIIHNLDSDVVSTDVNVWDKTMAINARGVFLGCKYAVPALIRAGGGVILNSSSFTALLGSTFTNVAYTASKGAVLSLTRELAVKHAKDNIRVNALCPGPIFTEAFANYFKNEEKKKFYLDRIPLRRFGTPEDVAKAALYLVSDDASYMTGNTFLIDGGITAAYLTHD